jgi:hypothetical protein
VSEERKKEGERKLDIGGERRVKKE